MRGILRRRLPEVPFFALVCCRIGRLEISSNTTELENERKFRSVFHHCPCCAQSSAIPQDDPSLVRKDRLAKHLAVRLYSESEKYRVDRKRRRSRAFPDLPKLVGSLWSVAPREPGHRLRRTERDATWPGTAERLESIPASKLPKLPGLSCNEAAAGPHRRYRTRGSHDSTLKVDAPALPGTTC